MTIAAIATSSECTLDEVICQIHSATGHEELWDSVASGISQLFDCTSVAIAWHQFSTGRGSLIYMTPECKKLAKDYKERFSIRNPWFMSSSAYKPGRVLTGDELVSEDELLKSDFYRQYLRPNGFFHRLCGVIARYVDDVYYLSIVRGRNCAAFGRKEIDLVQRLLTHLSIALENHWTLRSASGLNEIFWSVIEHFDNATFLVNKDGKVLRHNRKSKEFIARYDAVGWQDDKLVATGPVEQRALSDALVELAAISSTNCFGITKVITLPRARSEHPIILTLRPLGSTYSRQTGALERIIFLTAKNPTEIPHPHKCFFSDLYDFTPAQAGLSALIFSGYTLTDAAKSLHISDNTIRSHLKQIYLKTNTHGQMELLQLHGRICDDHF